MTFDMCAVCVAGANPLQVNELGHTPLSYAKVGEMHTLLKEREGKVQCAGAGLTPLLADHW